MTIREAALVLRDGSIFEGEAIGAQPPGGICSGEVVFNTTFTGYQEVISDPSYAGQIISFTTPHIGNYGTTSYDNEAKQVFARGVVVRDLARRRSNWRSEGNLDHFLRTRNVGGIAGIDTRRLTRILRESGSMTGAFGTASESELRAAALREAGTDGVNLVAQVTTPEMYQFGSGRFDVVAFDFGIKHTIVRCLGEFATVRIVPAATTAEQVMEMSPHGVFLSNGPGDPESVVGVPETLRLLLHAGVPIFGICLGHQLLALALGGTTFKLPFGHHGANHPVRNVSTGAVEITSQNHNFCIDPASLRDVVDVTHTNLNDDTNEGMRIRDARCFSVQYHPEAGPGPHDSRYLFGEFASLMDSA